VVSYLPGAPTVRYTMYRPSLIEWLAGGGIIAYGFTLFSLGVRYLHVVDHTIYDTEQEIVHETVPAGNTVPA